jgi:hypothetical protein
MHTLKQPDSAYKVSWHPNGSRILVRSGTSVLLWSILAWCQGHHWLTIGRTNAFTNRPRRRNKLYIYWMVSRWRTIHLRWMWWNDRRLCMVRYPEMTWVDGRWRRNLQKDSWKWKGLLERERAVHGERLTVCGSCVTTRRIRDSFSHIGWKSVDGEMALLLVVHHVDREAQEEGGWSRASPLHDGRFILIASYLKACFVLFLNV